MIEGSQSGKVRFGLVGCGRIGATGDQSVCQWAIARYWSPLSHASAIQQSGRADLVAVCDVDEAAASEASRLFGSCKYYLDYHAMLEQEHLDVLAIATRTKDRSRIIEAAVQHGIRAVFSEKPLTNSLEEADHLASLLEQKNVHFVYGTRRRFMPAYRRAKEIIKAGEIGRLTNIVVKFGSGLLFWGHPHSVDIASYFADDSEVECVQADLELDLAAVRDLVVDADPLVRMAYIRFRNGISAHVVQSQSFDVVLSGTRGMLAVRSDGSSLRRRSIREDVKDDGWLLAEEDIAFPAEPTGTLSSIDALMDAVLYGKDPGYSISLAVRNQEVLFGFVYSHLEAGRRISFPIERRGLFITGRSGERFA